MFEDIEFPEKRYVIKFKDGVTAQQRSTLIRKCKHRRASKVGYRKRKNPTDRHTHFYGNINDNEMDRLLDSKHVEYVEEQHKTILDKNSQYPRIEKLFRYKG